MNPSPQPPLPHRGCTVYQTCGFFVAPCRAYPLEHILESGTPGVHHGSSCTGEGYCGVRGTKGGRVKTPP